jgi:enamine deaminase RidA (YjgF/YER057c/UK114 family)
MSVDAKLKELGIKLPATPKAIGNYVGAKRIGGIVYTSGSGPRMPDGTMPTGIVGDTVTVKQAYEFAKVAGLNLLAAVHEICGTLDGVEVVKVFGMVNAVPGFTQQPDVMNGCSDLFVDLLGEYGRHTRSAVGVGSLPGNMPVEIEAIFKIHPSYFERETLQAFGTGAMPIHG